MACVSLRSVDCSGLLRGAMLLSAVAGHGQGSTAFVDNVVDNPVQEGRRRDARRPLRLRRVQLALAPIVATVGKQSAFVGTCLRVSGLQQVGALRV